VVVLHLDAQLPQLDGEPVVAGEVVVALHLDALAGDGAQLHLDGPPSTARGDSDESLAGESGERLDAASRWRPGTTASASTSRKSALGSAARAARRAATNAAPHRLHFVPGLACYPSLPSIVAR
jgi:hypothetical protein